MAPGLNLNVSKKGLGLSAGPRGIKASLSSQGRLTGSAGIPGSGITYRNSLNSTGESESNEAGENSLLLNIVDSATYISIHGPVISGKEMRKALILLASSTISLLVFVVTAIGPLGFILNPFLLLYFVLVLAYIRESKKNKELTRARKIEHLRNCNHENKD